VHKRESYIGKFRLMMDVCYIFVDVLTAHVPPPNTGFLTDARPRSPTLMMLLNVLCHKTFITCINTCSNSQMHDHESYTGDRTKEALVAFADSLVPSAGQPHRKHANLDSAPKSSGCNMAGEEGWDPPTRSGVCCFQGAGGAGKQARDRCLVAPSMIPLAGSRTSHDGEQ
jgi:hypothetical protein